MISFIRKKANLLSYLARLLFIPRVYSGISLCVSVSVREWLKFPQLYMNTNRHT